jgi:hypothetical protein
VGAGRAILPATRFARLSPGWGDPIIAQGKAAEAAALGNAGFLISEEVNQRNGAHERANQKHGHCFERKSNGRKPRPDGKRERGAQRQSAKRQSGKGQRQTSMMQNVKETSHDA